MAEGRRRLESARRLPRFAEDESVERLLGFKAPDSEDLGEGEGLGGVVVGHGFTR